MSKTKTTTHDMTEGNILKELILFALPLLLGNVFQLLYNTVDTIVVGRFVGKEALAAVGSTTMITNMVIFFFNGLSIGAGVVISRYFGAKNYTRLHDSVETTVGLTLILSAIFTVLGVLFVGPLLKLMATPEDVMPYATIYLRLFMGGISGLMIYNMASGILRAVGDTKRPLYFLIFTSILNIALDLILVIVFKMGVVGVALATIIAQFISAFLVIRLLTKTDDIYRFSWSEMKLDKPILSQIFKIGLPTAIQSTLTALSNTFVQSYVNFFGSPVMAGWSCYNKLDQFVFLPMSSLSNAATTFVGQNMGAKNLKRADRGTFVAVGSSLFVTFVITVLLFIFAEPANSIFTKDKEVIYYGSLFIKTTVLFLMANSITHTLAGAIRGRGNSAGPMVIMLLCFVVIRQIYLYIATNYFANTPVVVAMSYPVGWTTGCIIEVIYYFLRVRKQKTQVKKSSGQI